MSIRSTVAVSLQFLAVLSAGAAGFAQAGTFTVSQVTDNGTADGTCGSADCTLRDAIDLANVSSDLDTIKFSPTLFGTTTAPTPATISLNANLDPITAPVVILGPGAALLRIDGNANEIFNVNDGTTNPISVTIKGVTIEDGMAANGGCIANNGELLTVEDSVVQSCTATTLGGAIYSNGTRSRLTVRNTTVKNSNAGTNGGGIYVGSTNSNGILGALVENSTIGPTNSGQLGGGVYIGSPASPVTIDKSTILGNTVSVSGGGLYVNTPTGEAPVVVRSSTLSGNTASGTTDDMTGGGGAFINDPVTLVTFENSTISDNQATNENGGGVFVNDTDNSDINGNSLLVRFRNTTIVNNRAPDSNANTGEGGGIYTKSDIILQNVLLAQNVADGNENEIAQDNNADDTYSEFSLLETSAGNQIVALPGAGNIQDVLIYPAIAALADYGSGRQTHALKLEGLETAVDRGGNSPCLRPRIRNLDGRGALRPVDGEEDGTRTCDIGAFEFNGKAIPCPATPSTCTVSHVPTTAVLQIAKGTTPSANKVAIALSGGATPLADTEFFGRPQDLDGTANSFCVYADTDGNLATRELVLSAVLEAGERSSASLPLWKSTVTSTGGATTYANSLGNADGVRKVAQKTGTSPSVTFASLGANFKFPALPLTIPTGGVVVQNLMSTGNCVEYTFDAAAGANDYVMNNALKVDFKVVP